MHQPRPVHRRTQHHHRSRCSQHQHQPDQGRKPKSEKRRQFQQQRVPRRKVVNHSERQQK